MRRDDAFDLIPAGVWQPGWEIEVEYVVLQILAAFVAPPPTHEHGGVVR